MSSVVNSRNKRDGLKRRVINLEMKLTCESEMNKRILKAMILGKKTNSVVTILH